MVLWLLDETQRRVYDRGDCCYCLYMELKAERSRLGSIVEHRKIDEYDVDTTAERRCAIADNTDAELLCITVGVY